MFVIRSQFCKIFFRKRNFSNHIKRSFWFYFTKNYQFQSIFGIFMIPLYQQSKCVYFMPSLFLTVKISCLLLLFGIINLKKFAQSSYSLFSYWPPTKICDNLYLIFTCIFLPFSSRPNMPISCIICLFHAQFIFDCPNIGFYFDFRSPFGLLPSDFGVHHIGRVWSGIEEVIWVVEFPREG